MSTMRTPEELADSPNDILRLAKQQLLSDLAREGYVIYAPGYTLPETPLIGYPLDQEVTPALGSDS